MQKVVDMHHLDYLPKGTSIFLPSLAGSTILNKNNKEIRINYRKIANYIDKRKRKRKKKKEKKRKENVFRCLKKYMKICILMCWRN